MQGRKLILAIVAVVALGCCVIGVLSVVIGGRLFNSFNQNAIITDRNKAESIGHEIADYDLPAGYDERGAMNVVYKMVVIGSRDTDMEMMLMQFPSVGASREEMEQQMKASFRRQSSSGDVTWKHVEDRTVTIRGQEVVISVSEGSSKRYGTTQRQEIGVFEGKGGLVMLLVMGSKSEWDAEGLDQFLASIK